MCQHMPEDIFSSLEGFRAKVTLVLIFISMNDNMAANIGTTELLFATDITLVNKFRLVNSHVAFKEVHLIKSTRTLCAVIDRSCFSNMSSLKVVFEILFCCVNIFTKDTTESCFC